MPARRSAEKPPMRMHDLIPFSYAQRRWNQLPMRHRYPEQPVPRDSRDESVDCCPTCRWPLGTPGFVSFWFPVGHELFGKAICCPDCWPPPFGNARGVLTETAEKIAAMWESVLHRS